MAPEDRTPRQRIAALAERLQISSECQFVGVAGNSYVWKVTLTRPVVGVEPLVVEEFTAPGHLMEGPGADAVLLALMHDAWMLNTTDGQHEWMLELGYEELDADDDYRRVQEQTGVLEEFLGDDYEKFESCLL